MKKLSWAACVAMGTIALGGSARATAVTGSIHSWQAAVGGWTETANFGVVNNSAITGFTTANGVVLSVNNVVRQIGHGWTTWSGGYAGQVLANYDSSVVTFGLLTPVSGFGFFVEPDPFALVDVTLTTSNGLSFTQAVNGKAGAAFFGWTGGGVNGFTITSPQDFAVGEFWSPAPSIVPEPSAWNVMLLGLGGLGAMARLARRKPARVAALSRDRQRRHAATACSPGRPA